MNALITIILFALIISFGIVVRAAISADRLYRHLKSKQSFVASQMFKGDPKLGYANTGEFRAPESEPYEQDVSTRFELNGTWIPANIKVSKSSIPVILALGCSFTYGMSCNEDETYSYIVGKKLHGISLNAGLGGAGLAHMLLIAKKLIPEFKPNIVLVQYSPWLSERSIQPFSRSARDVIPTPFFSETSDGKIKLNPPIYKSKFFDLPSKFRYTPMSTRDYISFMSKVGIPLYINEHINTLIFLAKRELRLTPNFTRDKQKIVELAYNEIAEICARNNAKMVVVFMGGYDTLKLEDFPKEELDKIYAIKNLIFVDTTAPLFEHLKQHTPEEYIKTYNTVINTKPVMTDIHPNKAAHGIIAEEIVKALKKSESGNR
ncbi:MAG: hypothetical protein M1269_13075 [Chloroflexi bacterium]|nr:hypothetical protein [Chloroflexota bacterium]